ALGLLGSASAVALLAACGPGIAPAAPTSPPAPTGAQQPAAQPAGQQIKKGGTLRWGQVGDLVTIDAILWSPVSNNTLGQVNEMLIEYDDDLKIVPRLAESWEQSSDNTSIKLNLRKGVQFHTGREFTSDDVE